MKKRFLFNAVCCFVAVAAFWGCSESSGDSSAADSQIKVNSLEDLPNCYEKYEGETAFLLDEGVTYRCQNGRWNVESAPLQTVPTLDDLLNCSNRNQGDTVQVVSENAVYQCMDGSWQKYRALFDVKTSLDDMLACVKKREGLLTNVTEEHALYQCQDGEWVKVISYMGAVETADDLPNCTSKNADDSSYVKKENAVYLCIDEAWRYLGDFIESADNLKNCSEKRESERVYLKEDHVTLICSEGRWYRYNIYNFIEQETPESSSSAESSDSDRWEDYEISSSSVAKSSSSAATKSSSSVAKSSSSVAKSSSSVAKSSSSVAKSSSSVAKSSSSVAKSSSSVAKSSSSVAKSSSSVAKSSSSVAKSSSSVAKSSSSVVVKSSSSVVTSSNSVVVNGKYDCSVYNCVTTEYLNQKMLAAGKYGELLDTRDNQVYRTIEIGSQTWMAQNLNYASKDSYCYDGSSEQCAVYGRLYLWSSANSVCPEGWHLPSKAEWEKLVENTGTTKGEVALNLEYSGWNNAKDLYGFSVLPAGFKREDGRFFSKGSQTLFWTSESRGDIGFTDEYFFTSNSNSYGFSVRCIKSVAQNTLSSSSSAAVPKSSNSSAGSSLNGELFVNLGDKVYSATTSGQPVEVKLTGMPTTSDNDYIAVYFEPNLSGGYARDLNIRTGKDVIYGMRQHMYYSNKAPVVQESGYVASFTPAVDMSTNNLDDKTVHYYWTGWTSGHGHFKIVFDRVKLFFHLYVENTYLGLGKMSKDPIVMDNIELSREQPYGTNTCQVSNVRVAGFGSLDDAKAWDGLAF